MSSTGTFVVTCCLGGCALAYLELHPVDADDVQSIWDYFGGVVALGICASAGALSRRRCFLAVAVILGFILVSMLLLRFLTIAHGIGRDLVADYVALSRFHAWHDTSIFVLLGALTGAVAFSVVARRPGILFTGAVAGVTGLMLVALVAVAAWEIWPRRLTRLEPAMLATLVAFGPIMGLVLGVPFSFVDKKAVGGQDEPEAT